MWNEFSSSLCHVNLTISGRNIRISKIYSLRWLKCNEVAHYDNIQLLINFPEEWFKQVLIYNYYKNVFAPYRYNFYSSKRLESHIKSHCKKCQISSVRFCLDIIDE